MRSSPSPRTPAAAMQEAELVAEAPRQRQASPPPPTQVRRKTTDAARGRATSDAFLHRRASSGKILHSGSKTTMEEDGTSRLCRNTGEASTMEQGGGAGGFKKNTPEDAGISPPPAGSDLLARLARLSSLAARARAASSSRPSTSPKWCQDDCASSAAPRFTQGRLGIEEERQRMKKRKSPYATMPLFRSPLSRMLLSPRMQLPRASPLARHGTSPSSIPSSATCGGQRSMCDIDLNVQLEGNAQESEENVQPEGYAQDSDGIVQLEGYAWDSDENVQPEGYAQDSDGNVQPEGNAQESDGNVQPEGNAQESARKKLVLSDEKRREIFDALLARAKKGEITADDKKEVSEKFSAPIRTVQRIWKQGKNCLDQGRPIDVGTSRSKCGRKKINLDVSTLRDIPISSRTTIADVATHFGVSTSKVHTMKRDGVIKRVSNSIKPYLTEKNKKDRLKWCLSMLDPMSIHHEPVFKGMFDHVVIDEKWFYITRKTERYYSVPGAVEPTRTCKNKNYIPKIHILTAVGRPRFDSDGNCIFDGKIGCWPFVTYEAAKRSSVNRPAGTIEMKPIESITKDVMRTFMIDKVLPAIRAKWPREDANKPIYIQQDNAKPHVAPSDRLFCEAARQDGFDIRIECQPANSPDMNVLDLGFFSSLQSIQYKKSAKTMEELLAAVNQAFEEYSVCKSNRIFLTLHGCMKEVTRTGGGNGYDMPHIRKGMLERQGRLPLQLKCDASLVQNVIAQTID